MSRQKLIDKYEVAVWVVEAIVWSAEGLSPMWSFSSMQSVK